MRRLPHRPEAHLAQPTFNSPDRESEFAREGFTTLRLFDAAEAEALRREVDALAAHWSGPNHGPAYFSFLDPRDERRHPIEQLVRTHLTPAVARHMHGGRIQNEGLVAKAPGAGALAIHHHAATTDGELQREVNCWLALGRVDGMSGALTMIPRSHHLVPHIKLPTGPAYFAGFSEKVAGYAVAVPLDAGEAVLFDNSILHGSAPHEGESIRYAMACQLVPEESRNGLFVEGEEGWIDFIEGLSGEAVETILRTGARPPGSICSKRIPNRNRPISEEEFAALLAARGKEVSATASE